MQAGSTKSHRLKQVEQERGSVLQPSDPTTEARRSTASAKMGTNLFYEAAS